MIKGHLMGVTCIESHDCWWGFKDHSPAAKPTAGQLALVFSKVGLSWQLAGGNLSAEH